MKRDGFPSALYGAQMEVVWPIISAHSSEMTRRLQSDLVGISAFVATVEAGSFTAAAERVGLSKSAVGKSVARLEDHFGARLLERTTRALSPTTEGQTYYEVCVRILADLNEAEAQLASTRLEVSGRLRISLPVTFGRLWVMPVLLKLAHDHPRLVLDVSFTDRRVDLVEEGFDLVVRLGEPGDQAMLAGRRLGTQRAMVCAAPAYIAARGAPSEISDLTRHDCVGFARDGASIRWLLPDGEGGLSSVRLASRHIVSDGEALREAVASGLGLGYVHTWLAAEHIRSGRLVPVLSGTSFEGAPITALWPRSQSPGPKIRVALDALVTAFLPTPPWEVGFV